MVIAKTRKSYRMHTVKLTKALVANCSEEVAETW